MITVDDLAACEKRLTAAIDGMEHRVMHRFDAQVRLFTEICVVLAVLPLLGLLAVIVQPGQVPTAIVVTVGVLALAYVAYRRFAGQGR